ncbi:Ser-type protease [Labilithrix luteola]|uniref:Ser-type protease n=1 Tax=Labilithrix luteola TaxID=1391654 RepID=A0A0K1PLV9_9BACT|nr:S8 family serine peptidase [Labilithrix luteola]AKU94507.1 Ser-type protease [Labilithrix luteola]
MLSSGRLRGRRPLAIATAGTLLLALVTMTGASRSSEPSSAAVSAPVSSPTVYAPVTGRPNGAELVRMLGARAAETLAPNSGRIGALVAIPRGARAEDYGLESVAPGIGRLRATPAKIDAFGLAHPELRIEVAPPLHPLLDRVGQWVQTTAARNERGADGKGVMVGVADTGLDVTHPDMIDENGHSRVAWMLDLSLQPLRVHADLEKKFGITDDGGNVTAGAVLSGDMIDELLADIASGKCDEKTSGKKCAPSDEIGHGTHVAGIAASRGADGRYVGMAPAADIVFVRVTRSKGDGIENDDLVRAVQFMFDRADAEKRPMVVNLSLGSDFGPHDGTFMWEQTIASYVGPDHPGHAIVAAAGNSGSIVETPIHQSVRVTDGATMRVPVQTFGADSGSVQIWVTLREGADLKIGLDGPDGTWIDPVAIGHQNGKNTNDYNAGVIYGTDLPSSPIPSGSRGGVVVWTGKWPTGKYYVTLEGTGMAELYLQGLGDAGMGSDREASFANGVREGTINLPATHPSIIGVGCTVNRPRWTSIAGADVGLNVPVLDLAGGLPTSSSPRTRELTDGEVCWFSSAGPTATGVPKPEIAAPGALVVSAMSRSALPGTPGSVFTNPSCPTTRTGKADERCLQIDVNHGIAVGTSMSSPVVAGVVALLLQKDPTLNQEQILALLQAGAHRFRGMSPFSDQSSPGEVDALGALDALDQMHDPKLYLPHASQSWLTLSSDFVPADGSTPVTAIVELRTEDGQHRGDFFDKNRLQPVLKVDGKPVDTLPEMVRRGPGVYFFAWKPPAGLGGSLATFGATFDGVPIVESKTVPIATDRWNAAYPSHASGSGCSVHVPASSGPERGALLAAISLAGVVVTRRRARSSKRA